VEIEIRRLRNELSVTIRDNGRGFDSSKAIDGNGLRNMAMRVREAGGRFKVESRSNEGAIIEFRVPFEAPSQYGIARFFPSTRRRRFAE
jgi:signal transduction histidine kinase